MPDFGWKSGFSVEEWLLAEPYRFDFYQAVKILQILQQKGETPAATPNPDCEFVRFSSQPSLSFPASDIQDAQTGSPAEITVNFLGLAGALGPLPYSDTELLLERQSRKDLAFREFLDVFHHRLISLFYRVRRTHFTALDPVSPEQTSMARYLYSFFGLALLGLQNRQAVPDRTFLYYAGLLSQKPRSAVGLQQMLTDHFRAPVEVLQSIGLWRNIEPDQWTYIGREGRNQQIGAGIVLGTRVWDQSGRFDLVLGPMPLAQFRDFLPSGNAFRPLCEMTRFFVGLEPEFGVRFKIQAAEVPPWQLGKERLGWTSWLRTSPFLRDDEQVCLASFWTTAQ